MRVPPSGCATTDVMWATLTETRDGGPGIDPEVAVRPVLAGLLLGITHDRRLMREAQVNLAVRWFIGYHLHEALPDHSSLTRNRQRWGAERFRRVFARTAQACVAAGIAKGEVVHVHSSLIRANVSWDAIARRYADGSRQPKAMAAPRRAEAGRSLRVHHRHDATLATKGPTRNKCFKAAAGWVRWCSSTRRGTGRA